MIESHIIASFDTFVDEALGHNADTKINTCFVFQVNSDEKSAESEKRMTPYSSFLVE